MFYIAAAVAVVATLLVVTRTNLVHALLYLVVSLFAVAVIFFTLGAPFVAALEVIVYAGAIMMLFIFAVMLLNVRADDEQMRVPRRAWIGPVVLVAVLLAEVVYGVQLKDAALAGGEVGPAAVSTSLFGPYVLGVELASMLLLAALVGARHVAAQPDAAPAELGPEYVATPEAPDDGEADGAAPAPDGPDGPGPGEAV